MVANVETELTPRQAVEITMGKPSQETVARFKRAEHACTKGPNPEVRRFE